MGVDLTISIINTNNRDLLRNCLRSIFENTRRISLEVYVVDNACTDGSAEMVEAEFPQVRLIRNETRLGFCANHNQVLGVGTGRYLMILNEDILVLPEAFDYLVEFMDIHPEAGIAGPKLLNANGSFQAADADFPTLGSEFLVQVGLSRIRYGPYFPSHECDDEVHAADWVGGACLVIRRETMEQVGLLDEDFFVYSEETDWCYRAKKAGWQVYYVPQAQIIHLGEQAWKQLDGLQELRHRTRRRLRLQKSTLLFFRKHYGVFHELVLRFLIWSTSLPKAIGWSCLSLFPGHRGEIAKIEAHSYWEMAWIGGSWK